MSKKLLKFRDVLQQEFKDKDFRKHYEEEGRKLEVGYKITKLRHELDMTQEHSPMLSTKMPGPKPKISPNTQKRNIVN